MIVVDLPMMVESKPDIVLNKAKTDILWASQEALIELLYLHPSRVMAQPSAETPYISTAATPTREHDFTGESKRGG